MNVTTKAKDLKKGQTIKIGWGVAYTITRIEMEADNPNARFIHCEYLLFPLFMHADADVIVVGSEQYD